MFLDHILIATNDLDQSAEIMKDIGFELTAQGVHRDRGTANRLILFDGTYLELIGVNDLETVKSNRADFLQFLDRKQGLYMFALGDDDLQGQSSRLAGSEIITSDVKYISLMVYYNNTKRLNSILTNLQGLYQNNLQCSLSIFSFL